MSKQPTTRIIHPVLFSAYPVLFVFGLNVAEIPVSHLWLPLSVTLGMGLILWLLAGLLFRSAIKGALVASLSMMMLLPYKHAYVGFVRLSGWDPGWRLSLGAWLMLLVAGVFLIKFAGPAVAAASSRIANVVAAILVMAACAPLLAHLVGGESAREGVEEEALKQSLAGWSRVRGPHPDIYYIVLDGYGRADMLKRHYDFDNTAFLDRLKSRGFFVADRSTSNYATTPESLRSSLNMGYRPHDSLQSNRVARLLRLMGYEYVLVPSGYPITSKSPIADLRIDIGTSTRTELTALLLEWSAASFLFNGDERKQLAAIHKGWWGVDLSGMTAWHQQITRSLEAIALRAKAQGPQFVFAHIISPHPPYVFNRDGSLNTKSTMTDLSGVDGHNPWRDREQFVDQLTHLNKLLDTLIETILANSRRPPVIILQADHGTFFLGDTAPDSRENPSHGFIRERMANLFACYGPKEVRDHFQHSITPVNVFRVVFNQLFGAQYDLLANKNYWSYVEPLRDVTIIATEVTDRAAPGRSSARSEPVLQSPY